MHPVCGVALMEDHFYPLILIPAQFTSQGSKLIRPKV